MSSTEEITAVRVKITDLELELLELKSKLESKSLSEKKELIIRQQIIEYTKLLNTLYNQSAPKGKKKYLVPSIGTIITNYVHNDNHSYRPIKILLTSFSFSTIILSFSICFTECFLFEVDSAAGSVK